MVTAPGLHVVTRVSRAPTPVDAKLVWDSFVKARVRPTARAVAEALAQSGQFLPISKSSIARWKKNGWATPASPLLPRADPMAKVEAAVPVLTGDPTKRVAELVGDEAGAEVKAQRDKLRELLDGELMILAQRESYITIILLMREVQEKPQLVETAPREIGALLQVLANSLTISNGGLKQLLDIRDHQMKFVPNGNATEAPLNDPLSDAINAFAQAAKDFA